MPATRQVLWNGQHLHMNQGCGNLLTRRCAKTFSAQA